MTTTQRQTKLDALAIKLNRRAGARGVTFTWKDNAVFVQGRNREDIGEVATLLQQRFPNLVIRVPSVVMEAPPQPWGFWKQFGVFFAARCLWAVVNGATKRK